MDSAKLKKEYETLKRKYSVPSGDNLKEMLSTEAGRRRYSERKMMWDNFKKRWNIVFFIKDKPVFRKEPK